jgi:hypothetical protein
LSSFPFLQNQNKKHLYHIAQKIAKLKLKTKNFIKDQRKSGKKKLFVVCRLLLVTCSSKDYLLKVNRGEGISYGETQAMNNNGQLEATIPRG